LIPFLNPLDYLAGLFQTEEQREQGIIILKILKNRFGGYVNYKIALGVDYNKMRIFQLDDDVADEVDMDVADADTSDDTAFSVNRKRGRRR